MTDIRFDPLPKGVVVKQWANFTDNIGNLLPLEFKDLPFVPKRIFVVSGVPEGSERGGHAHRETRQYLLCVKGKIKVLLNDGTAKQQFMLTQGQGTLVEKMTWDSQKFITGEDVLVVLCSTEFNQSDYILDFGQFMQLKKNKKRGKQTQ